MEEGDGRRGGGAGGVCVGGVEQKDMSVSASKTRI